MREEGDGILAFRLYNCNVSFANAIRRTILSDIPVAVFITEPHDKCKTDILVNTSSRMHNERIKHQLSCIPICYPFPDPDILANYFIECNVQNTTSQVLHVTSRDFQLVRKHSSREESASDKRRHIPSRDELFPAHPLTNDYIHLMQLRPEISKELPGDHLHFISQMSIATHRDSSKFNVVSTCSYGFTVDPKKQKQALEEKVLEWQEAQPDITPEELEVKKTDWTLLDGQRIFVPNSFDFVVESIGIYTNEEIVAEACRILVRKLREMLQDDSDKRMQISPSETTIPHAFDIRLFNEDHTIGKVLEYCLYNGFFMNAETLSFCGFSKKHPHDEDSWIRIAYKENLDADVRTTPDNVFLLQAKRDVLKCIHDAVQVFEDILLAFD